MNRPFAESAEQNKIVIAEALKKLFIKSGKVLEIGSGTGQHARYFASLFPQLDWHPSELSTQIITLEQGVCNSGIDNLVSPVVLDVASCEHLGSFDYMFTANTLHIMSWELAKELIAMASSKLVEGGVLATYGPFNIDGRFTSESNARFDLWLKQKNPLSGVRDIGALEQQANSVGLSLVETIEMPVNNKILVWCRE